MMTQAEAEAVRSTSVAIVNLLFERLKGRPAGEMTGALAIATAGILYTAPLAARERVREGFIRQLDDATVALQP